MKRLLLLTIMTMLSLMGFSQTGTVTKDTTKVVISSEVARQIAKDLIRLDGCIEENKELYTKISKIEEREKQKDNKIEILVEKDKNNQIIIGEKDKQIGLYQNMTTDLQNEIRTTNNKIRWWKTGTFVGGGLTILLLIIAF